MWTYCDECHLNLDPTHPDYPTAQVTGLCPACQRQEWKTSKEQPNETSSPSRHRRHHRWWGHPR